MNKTHFSDYKFKHYNLTFSKYGCISIGQKRSMIRLKGNFWTPKTRDAAGRHGPGRVG